MFIGYRICHLLVWYIDSRTREIKPTVLCCIGKDCGSNQLSVGELLQISSH